jgi:hypothetical protein
MTLMMINTWMKEMKNNSLYLKCKCGHDGFHHLPPSDDNPTCERCGCKCREFQEKPHTFDVGGWMKFQPGMTTERLDAIFEEIDNQLINNHMSEIHVMRMWLDDFMSYFNSVDDAVWIISHLQAILNKILVRAGNIHDMNVNQYDYEREEEK